MTHKLIASLAVIAMALASCDDTTDTLGNSLTSEADRFEILTDTFTVTTRSMVVDSVLSRSQYSYLGRVRDPETSTYVTSNYTSQFTILEMLGDNTYMPPIDSVVSRTPDGIAYADSCRLNIYFRSSVGDSLNAMRLTVMEMQKPVEEARAYYSNYDPEAEGLIRTDARAIRKHKMYTTLDLNLSDSLRSNIISNTNLQSVTIPLNDTYYDINGKEYGNYGTYIMQRYYDNPDDFRNSYNFAHRVCPGFYIKSTDGLGVMSEVYLTELVVYFRFIEDGDTVTGSSLMSGTEEVMQTTRIDTDRKRLEELAADPTCTHLKSPAGIFTEVTLPVEQIKYGHTSDTISSARVVFSCINDTSTDSYGPPEYVLLLPKDSLYSFFENKNTPDNVTSYLAAHSSSYNTYTFNNIASLVTHMWDNRGDGSNPDWCKAVLVPVTVSTSTSSTSSSTTITGVSNAMSLSSTRLVGGPDNDHQPITISVIYNRLSDPQ